MLPNELKIKSQLKEIVDAIVEKVESEYEVFYSRTDSIVETVYCLAIDGKITTLDELKKIILKLLKSHLTLVEIA